MVGGDVDMMVADGGIPEDNDLDDMKKRLKEMEDEAAALREMQAKVEKEMQAATQTPPSQDPATAAANKEEVDARSVFVGNVDYSCTPEEVQQHFQSCGTVNRVTIRSTKFGQPKGYAYVEFVEPEAVQEAILLNESELHGRQLKMKFPFLFNKFYILCRFQLPRFNVVSAKRTNVPGMKVFRARRPNPYMGYHSRIPYMASPFFPPYGYGKVPRFRMPMRYSPYY